jgi:hypothetical protein
VDSNDLAIGSTAEGMGSVPAVAPAQGQTAAENPQNPLRRRPPGEPAPAAGEEAADAESVPNADGAPHRVDSLA